MPCTESAWPSHHSRAPPERRRKGHRQQRLEGGNTPWGDPFGLALLDPSTLELSECGLDAEHESIYGEVPDLRTVIPLGRDLHGAPLVGKLVHDRVQIPGDPAEPGHDVVDRWGIDRADALVSERPAMDVDQALPETAERLE